MGMMRRSVLSGVSLLVIAGWSASAEASVSGKVYNVTVRTSFFTTFDDVYTYQEDGTFISSVGGDGAWSETNLGPITLWQASFDDGSGFEVELVGLQLGQNLLSVGTSNEGDFYLIKGSEATTRKKKVSGSYSK